MKQKKLATIALVAAMAIGTLGFSIPAKATEPTTTTDYVLTIPATLSVASAGWNATDGITAKVKSGDTFDSSKKLTVTAASANEWNLKSGKNAIAYKMASATEQEKSYADATATTSLEISAEDLNTGNYEAPFGIVVEDYTDKPAGEYKDTVTFTAKVEDAKPEYYNKLTKINDNFDDQVFKLKMLGRGRESYNSSLTAAQAWKLAKYQAAIDNVTVYVIMSSQDDGYEIHYAVSTDASATEHKADLYNICNDSNPVRMYYIAQ